MIEENLNLIRKIAWSFYHSNKRIELDDLIGEACLIYLESMKSYNPEKSKKSSWAYNCIRNGLIDFIKRDTKEREGKMIEWIETNLTPDYEFFEKESFRSLPRSRAFKELSEDTRSIINLILRNPQYYAPPCRNLIGNIKNHLREKWGWEWKRIFESVRVLRVELKETEPI